ncbi:MAG TPA: WGxxGxxG family protein [Thermoanaerobaculia bacterium]|jgi:MYXO-CTERM domain-containing protein|nr:WGxxGxxG family protein [Thermoanaerobaculia bacterium]
MKKLAVFLLMLGLLSFVAVPVTAQDTGTTTGTTYEDRDDDGPDMGWLGLLGLAGLLGLKKRTPEVHRDTAARTTTATR